MCGTSLGRGPHLKSLTLYGKQPGQVRSLEFNLGELNIVTGDSLTGKTSIWDVTNYCMASSGDNYPNSAGKLREYVDVFAVQIVRGDHQLFVARPAARGTTPSPGSVWSSSSQRISRWLQSRCSSLSPSRPRAAC